MSKRALIIGGSVGGLFAANCLRDTGWDVTVFERNPEELAGRGAGISTHPQLHDVMRRLGIPFDDSMGISVKSVVFIDHDGKIYEERPTERVMSSWGRVFRSLRDRIPDANAVIAPVFQKIFDFARLVRQAENNFFDSATAHQIDLIKQERRVRYRHDRLRCIDGQWTKASPFSASEYESLHVLSYTRKKNGKSFGCTTIWVISV